MLQHGRRLDATPKGVDPSTTRAESSAAHGPPLVLNGRELPLARSPARFVLIANNPNAAWNVSSCMRTLRLTSDDDVIVRFNHAVNTDWLAGAADVVVVAWKGDEQATLELVAARRRWPRALLVVLRGGGIRGLPLPLLNASAMPDATLAVKGLDELDGHMPSAGFAMIRYLLDAYPRARLLTAGFDFHAEQHEEQHHPSKNHHAFDLEREVVASMPHVEACVLNGWASISRFRRMRG